VCIIEFLAKLSGKDGSQWLKLPQELGQITFSHFHKQAFCSYLLWENIALIFNHLKFKNKENHRNAGFHQVLKTNCESAHKP
jgi:hypothetical protein